VGVMLYQALAEQLPFQGSAREVLMKKRSMDPIPPLQIVSTIPEDLNNLCMELLRRDAAQRPKGFEILRRLGTNRTQSLTGKAQFFISRPPELVGRKPHLEILQDAYKSVRKGSAIIVNVHGSSGLGKSSLVNYFLHELDISDEEVVILTGRCYEQESLPYKAFDSIIDALSRYLQGLPEIEVVALLPRHIFALLRLFPVLRQVTAISSRSKKYIEMPDSQELRRRAFSALKELFARLTDRIPVILFIDDLQWGDIDSAMLINELLSPPNLPALLLIASYRSEDVNVNPLLSSLSALNVEKREVVIKKLSLAESQELAIKLIGEQGKDGAAQAELLAREADGSPFFIDELARYLRSGSELIKKGSDSAPARDDSSDPLAFTVMLNKMIEKRFNRLPESAQRLLQVVVVAGQPISRAVAKRVAQLESDEQSAVSYLRTRHLIRIIEIYDQEALETYHDRIRAVIAEQLSAESLKQLHRQLGQELETINGIEPERLAGHFHRGGDAVKASEYAIAAAEKAYTALAFDHAAYLYKLALELLPPERAQESPDLRARLAESLVNAGRSTQAAQAYALAAKESHLAANIIKLESCAAEQFLLSGHIDEALSLLLKVLNKVGAKWTPTPWRAFLSLLYHRAQIRLRGLNFQERDTSQLSQQELIKLDIYWSVGMGLSIVDTIRGMDFQSRYLLLALKAGEPYRVARAFSWEIAISSLGGGRTHKRTEQYIKAAAQLSDKLNNPHIEALTAMTRGGAAFMEGRFSTGREQLNYAETLMRERCRGVVWELDTVLLFLLRCLIMLGELGETARRLPELVKEAQERGDLYAEINLRTRISYMLMLIADEPIRAQQELQQSIARWSDRGFLAQHFFAFIGSGEIELYCQNGAAAWQLINDKWPVLNRSMLLHVQFLRIETIFLRGRAALAAALASNGNEARHLIKEAEICIKKLAKEQMPWSNALALLLKAGIGSWQAKKEYALKLFDQAESELQASEMLLYAMAARRRRGQLLKGEQGATLIKEADDWMNRQLVNNPERITAMLAPMANLVK
jgi:hypothetical protein